MTIQTATIVTRYEVNNVQHVQGLEQIRQKQEQLKKQMEDWNATVKHHEAVTAQAWKTAGIAVAGITAAVVAGGLAFKSYAEQTRLATAAAGADVDRLRKASAGLKNETELLRFAAVAQNGALKLNNEEMAEAQRAIRAWTREGFDAVMVTEKVTEAITKGEAEGFKDLGVTIRETKTDAERYIAIKELLASKAKKVSDSVVSETESIQALGTRFEDTFERIKKSIGQLVISMEPLIRGAASLAEKGAGMVDMIAQGWGALADVASGDREALFKRFGRDSGTRTIGEMNLGGGPSSFTNGFWGTDGKGEKVWIDGGALDEYTRAGGNAADWIRLSGGSRELQARQTSFGADNSLAEAEARQKARDEAAKAEYRRIYGREKPEDKAPTDDELRKLAVAQVREALRAAIITEGRNMIGRDSLADYGLDPGQRWESTFSGRSLGERAGGVDEFGRPIDEGAELSKIIRGDDAAKHGARKTKLEETFGPLSDFDGYKMAFETLTGAVGSSMKAWIDGSMSAGQAFKKFIADALGGIAVQMGIEAIKESAFAIASLAAYDYPGAALHGKAAAAMGAGAIAAMIAAKSLGGGGSSPAAGAGAGGGAAPSSGGGGGARGDRAGNTYVVSYNDSFTRQSSYEREREARRLISTVMGMPEVVN